MNKIIEFENVTKSFRQADRDFNALDNVEVNISKGAYIAIVGQSGSGKSTMLNLMTGIDHPTSGLVKINGEDIHRLGESELASWRGKTIGIVFQFFQLIPTLTILENLLLAMEFVNTIPKSNRTERAVSLLKLVNIADHRDKFPSGLSGGEQQRAAIARALANDPDILVADEPTGNLDSKTAASIKAIFADLINRGKTVIVVTHESISDSDYDRVIRLQDGQIVDGNSTANATRRVN